MSEQQDREQEGFYAELSYVVGIAGALIILDGFYYTWTVREIFGTPLLFAIALASVAVGCLLMMVPKVFDCLLNIELNLLNSNQSETPKRTRRSASQGESESIEAGNQS